MTMAMIDRRCDPQSHRGGGTTLSSTPPCNLAGALLPSASECDCHRPATADSAPAYAVESQQAIKPLPGPASSLPSSSRTAASLSLLPPTGDRVFRLPPEGGGGWWPSHPIRRSPPPSPDRGVTSLPDDDPAAGPLSLISQNGGLLP